MQKLITKYGLAAHLALLAVAPLFLLPHCVLWFSALASIWLLMEPSRIATETLREARKRVSRSIFRDPLFWLLLVIVLYAAVRWANGGVALTYDAEFSTWSISDPRFPILPGSADAAGYPEFAASVALLVVVQGCRHALGKSARMAFLLLSSAMAGAVAAVMSVMLVDDCPAVLAAVGCALANPRFIGSAMGLYLLAGTVALLAAYERKWRKAMPLTMFSIGGTAAGLFMFAPPMVQVAFGAAELALLFYSFAYARMYLRGSGEFKYLVTFALAATLAVVLVVTVLPSTAFASRLAAYKTGAFFPDGFWSVRDALATVSMKVWKGHPWLGTGLGSFPVDFRFHATEVEWAVVPSGQLAPLNGYWQMLAERGITGVVPVLCAAAFLLWTFGVRLLKGIAAGFPHPACWLGVLALLALLAETAVDCSCLIPGMFAAVSAFLAISAASFPKEDRNG